MITTIQNKITSELESFLFEEKSNELYSKILEKLDLVVKSFSEIQDCIAECNAEVNNNNGSELRIDVAIKVTNEWYYFPVIFKPIVKGETL